MIEIEDIEKVDTDDFVISEEWFKILKAAAASGLYSG